MDCFLWFFVGLLLIVGGGVGLLRLLGPEGGRVSDPQVVPLLRQALRALDGMLETDDSGRTTALSFAFGPSRARLTIPDRHGPAILEYSLPYYLPPIFALRPAGAPPTMFGRGQILPAESKDPDFDGRFQVRTNSEPLMAAIRTSEVREAIRALPRLLHPMSDRISISVGANVLRIEIAAIAAETPDLLSFLRVAETVARAFFAALGRPVGREAGVEILESGNSELAPGACRVCGEALSERPVCCRRCRTPHHRECWEYFGACSIFGCNTRDFVEG